MHTAVLSLIKSTSVCRTLHMSLTAPLSKNTKAAPDKTPRKQSKTTVPAEAVPKYARSSPICKKKNKNAAAGIAAYKYQRRGTEEKNSAGEIAPFIMRESSFFKKSDFIKIHRLHRYTVYHK